MSFKKTSNKKKKQILNDSMQAQGIDWYYLIPLAMIGAFVPTIVYLEIIPLPEHIARFWTSEQLWDFFSFHKARWILILTVVSLVSMFFGRIQNTFRFQKDPIYIPMGVYALFIILSTIFVEPIYRDVALQGFPDRFEGMYVLLAYLLVAYMAMTLVRTEAHLKVIIGSLLLSASFLSILGIFQYFDMDIFKTEFGKNFIVPGFYEGAKETLNFTFGKHTIYATMYNTNYVGSYMSMLAIMSLVLYIFAKQTKTKIMFGLVFLLTFTALIGSNSRAGMVGAVVGLLLVAILLNKHLLVKWRQILIIGVIITVAAVSMDVASGGRVTGQITSLLKDVDIKDEQQISMQSQFNDLIINDNKATLDMTREKLNIELLRADSNLEYHVDDYKFYDENNNPLDIEFVEADYVIKFADNRFSNYILVITGNLVQITVDEFVVHLGADYDGMLKFSESDLTLVGLHKAPSWGFEGRETIGSSRGYIWSRTLPMLKETALIGFGPDTYAIYFPQSDYVAKKKYLGDYYTIVDKPHNLYLQIAVNTGVISLIAFLTMVGMYYYSLYINCSQRNYNNTFYIMSVALAGAVTAYLVSGIFNDSLVSVSPVFWILLGIGYACNRNIRFSPKDS